MLLADRFTEAFFDVGRRGAAFSAAFLALYPAGERLFAGRLCLLCLALFFAHEAQQACSCNRSVTSEPVKLFRCRSLASYIRKNRDVPELLVSYTTLALTLSPVLPHSDSCGGYHAGIRRVNNNYRVPPHGHGPKERDQDLGRP